MSISASTAGKIMQTEFTLEQLTQLEQRLLALQADISQTLGTPTDAGATVSLDQSRVGRLSRMDAMQQQAMAKAEKERLQQRLQQVTRALTRLSENDYGFCMQCDERITLQRLMIKPESLLCIQCQERAEK